ncbi:SCP-2 sterol transfer family protein [Brevibacillus gelatini]|uniref:SCP-2 sterol transfer family protein n=1 Tax=Brevibacillus gelatini TaxID=1655277 RepID=A0A3M8AP47_9BACL|nr:SCP2 sterol-binding domain-containing protein [Brevibacillus gelatini]RNB53006.1 SCP-2 sterol transfer family protein [Brevibacillus gelatini]
MIGLGRLLHEVGERLQKKTHLRHVTAGWEKRIGIVVDDTQSRWQITVSKGSISAGVWEEEQSADLIVRGDERQMEMLFGGDELVYALAKQQVHIAGTLRDQLKLDAILRLTCK